MLAFGTLAILFVLFSLVVASGGMVQADHGLFRTLLGYRSPALRLPALAVALLGGVEVTLLAAVALAIYLWRKGWRGEIAVLLVLPAAELLEFIYKRVVIHPGPPSALEHGDAPTLLSLLGADSAGNSFPSGHVTRTVLVYGLIAFVIWRLGRRGWLRRAAIAVAAVLSIAMAVDRLYLGVHWESDVMGGLLLGGTCLAGAILWLDRPRPASP